MSDLGCCWDCALILPFDSVCNCTPSIYRMCCCDNKLPSLNELNFVTFMLFDYAILNSDAHLVRSFKDSFCLECFEMFMITSPFRLGDCEIFQWIRKGFSMGMDKKSSCGIRIGKVWD